MSSPKSIDSALDTLVARFTACFHDRLGPVRKVGREAEFPLVTADGRAGDVAALWELLLSGSGFEPQYNNPRTRDLMVAVQRGNLNIAVEVGRGTIELSLGPFDDLWQLQAAFDQAVALVARVAARCGQTLLGFGIQPRTPPSAALMTPRPRYTALYRAIGAPWLHLTTTAADQTHVDITRGELLDAINWMNLLSGPLVAICANSPVYGGRAGRFLSGREGQLGGLGETRYGMTPRRFGDVAEFIRYLCDYRCFVLPEGDEFVQINIPYTQFLKRHPDASFDQFLWHDHYVWNSARARIQNSTIEVRPACQQPPGESLVANALALGWVESLREVGEYATDALGPDPWPTMLRYRRAVVRDGLAAQEPVPHLIRTLVQIAESGLTRRGRGEERLLQPVWTRLERRACPGESAKQLFMREGMDALIAHCRLGVT
jgi:gamma-glutamylcysteine synthetase